MAMKLGIFCDESFDPKIGNGFGGFGFLAKTLITQLNKGSYDVESFLLVPTNKKIIDESLDKHIVPVYVTPSRSVFQRQINLFLSLKKTLARINIDTILSIEAPEIAIMAMSSILGIKKRILWLQDPRDTQDWNIIQNDLYGQMEFSKIKLAKCKFLNSVVNWIDRPTYWAQAEYLESKGLSIYKAPKNTVVKLVRNPINIPLPGCIHKSDQPSILFLGRLDPIKRPTLFFKLAAVNPGLDFFVAGDTQNQQLKQFYQKTFGNLNNLHFLGHVGGVDKVEILSKAWLLVNTSVHEALPISFIEALSYKIPIISTQNPENITTQFGIYIDNIPITSIAEEENLVTKLSKQLHKLLANNKLRIELGNKGYNYAKENHEMSKVIGQVVNNLKCFR